MHMLREGSKKQEARSKKQDDHDPSSTSPSSSSSKEEEGLMSTSVDVMYGEKVKSEFDFMISQLRESYWESKSTKLKTEEKNIEFEVTPRKSDLVNRESWEVEMKKEESLKGGTSSGGEELKGKEGPRFQDLGGMYSVLQELKMEIIVPLCHLQLPQWRTVDGWDFAARAASL